MSAYSWGPNSTEFSLVKASFTRLAQGGASGSSIIGSW